MKGVNPKRRNFVKTFIKALPLIGGVPFIYPIYKYSTFTQNSKFSIAIPLDELNLNISKYSKALIKKNKDSLMVFDARCTHMGCILNIDEKNKKFVCPCHNSEFSFEGKRLKGPAKRDLDILSYTIKDSILYIG